MWQPSSAGSNSYSGQYSRLSRGRPGFNSPIRRNYFAHSGLQGFWCWCRSSRRLSCRRKRLPRRDSLPRYAGQSLAVALTVLAIVAYPCKGDLPPLPPLPSPTLQYLSCSNWNMALSNCEAPITTSIKVCSHAKDSQLAFAETLYA